MFLHFTVPNRTVAHQAMSLLLSAEQQLEKLFLQIPGGSEKMQIHLFCLLLVSNSCFALSGLSTRAGVTCPNVPEGPG